MPCTSKCHKGSKYNNQDFELVQQAQKRPQEHSYEQKQQAQKQPHRDAKDQPQKLRKKHQEDKKALKLNKQQVKTYNLLSA